MTAYKEIIASKRATRENAFASAHQYVAKTHGHILSATGKPNIRIMEYLVLTNVL